MEFTADPDHGYDVRSHYAFGQSDAETNRLIVQAEVLRPFTEHLLRTAGLDRGMRVLDLGCGTGDAAVLAADMVGASGEVVAIDQDELVLRTARRRTETAGAANVTFRAGSAESFDEPGSFDLVMSRCVAFFAADPGRFFGAAARAARPGGTLVLQEPHARWLPVSAPDPRNGQFSSPRITDVERVGEAFSMALASAAPSHDVALRIAEHLSAAGLPRPELSWNITVGTGPDSRLYALMAASFRSMVPQMRKHGIDGFDDLDTDSLEEHLRTLAVQHGSQVSFYSLVSALVRL